MGRTEANMLDYWRALKPKQRVAVFDTLMRAANQESYAAAKLRRSAVGAFFVERTDGHARRARRAADRHMGISQALRIAESLLRMHGFLTLRQRRRHK